MFYDSDRGKPTPEKIPIWVPTKEALESLYEDSDEYDESDPTKNENESSNKKGDLVFTYKPQSPKKKTAFKIGDAVDNTVISKNLKSSKPKSTFSALLNKKEVKEPDLPNDPEGESNDFNDWVD